MEITEAEIQVGEEFRKEEAKNNHTLVWGIKPDLDSSGQSENFGATWEEQPSNHQNQFNSATCNQNGEQWGPHEGTAMVFLG